jgi:hypothetical protein
VDDTRFQSNPPGLAYRNDKGAITRKGTSEVFTPLVRLSSIRKARLWTLGQAILTMVVRWPFTSWSFEWSEKRSCDAEKEPGKKIAPHRAHCFLTELISEGRDCQRSSDGFPNPCSTLKAKNGFAGRNSIEIGLSVSRCSRKRC